MEAYATQPQTRAAACTTEADVSCDSIPDCERIAVHARGIGPESVGSHARFRDEILPGLSAPGRVWACHGSPSCVRELETFVGRTREGELWTAFLIGPDGRLFRICRNAMPGPQGVDILSTGPKPFLRGDPCGKT